jgi:hypothetical protein
MTIQANDDDNDNKVDKKQKARVVSTKIQVDRYDSFNLLAEYLFKTGAIETSTPSALLRNSITQLLHSYHDDIENYRITKRQGTADNNGHQLRNIENNQILGNERLHPPVNDDGRTHHQGMNMAPVKETEYLREKVPDNNKLPMNSGDLEPSSIQSTQEALKETKREMQFLGNHKQPRTKDPIANLYKLDLAKFMYTLVTLDRQNKSKLVYLEVDEVTKDVLHIIPSYSLENWKKEKADKN